MITGAEALIKAWAEEVEVIFEHRVELFFLFMMFMFKDLSYFSKTRTMRGADEFIPDRKSEFVWQLQGRATNLVTE